MWNRSWLSIGIWVILASYWIALFIATHVPMEMVLLPGGVPDLIPHFITYAVLAVLFATALLVTARRLNGRHFVAAWILIAVYGAIDEVTQPLVGRQASLLDWLADAAGAAVGLMAVFLWHRWRKVASLN
jgi:VanZ family protein